MQTLTIQFSYMMLYLRTNDGMDVLLPAAGHRATVAQSGVGMVVAAPGTRVWITKDGQPLQGRVTVDYKDRANPTTDLVVGARGLMAAYGVKKRFVHRSYLRSDPKVPAALNARVELNGGRLEGASCLCQKDARAASETWVFPAQNYWHKRLTDRTIYSLDMDAGADYRVCVHVPGQAQTTFDAADGTYFMIDNGDLPGVGGTTGGGELTEMKAIYDLYDPTLAGEIDYPRADFSAVPSASGAAPGAAALFTPEVPMCSGMGDCEEGSTDPECEEP